MTITPSIALITLAPAADESTLHIVLTLIVLPVVVAGLTAIITLLVTKAGEVTARRRDRYAEAVKTLVSWSEIPYRVRRRTDDNPSTLSGLADRGHDLQERLACHEAWIAADHPRLARSYAKARATITSAVAPALTEAWTCQPVNSASEMNLGSWGPAATCQAAVIELQRDISSRFGLRQFRRGTRTIRDRDREGASPTPSAGDPIAHSPAVGASNIRESDGELNADHVAFALNAEIHGLRAERLQDRFVAYIGVESTLIALGISWLTLPKQSTLGALEGIGLFGASALALLVTVVQRAIRSPGLSRSV